MASQVQRQRLGLWEIFLDMFEVQRIASFLDSVLDLTGFDPRATISEMVIEPLELDLVGSDDLGVNILKLIIGFQELEDLETGTSRDDSLQKALSEVDMRGIKDREFVSLWVRLVGWNDRLGLD